MFNILVYLNARVISLRAGWNQIVLLPFIPTYPNGIGSPALSMWAPPSSSLWEGRKLTLIPPVLQNNCPHSYTMCWPLSSPISWGLLKLLSILNCQGSSQRGLIFLLIADHAMVMTKLPWQWAGFQFFFPSGMFPASPNLTYLLKGAYLHVFTSTS